MKALLGSCRFVLFRGSLSLVHLASPIRQRLQLIITLSSFRLPPSSLLFPAARRMLKWRLRGIIMLHQNTLDAAHTTLAIIDMQEGFRSVISDFTETAARIALVAHAAQLLNIPVIVTEQYPKGLGHTANEIKAVLPDGFNFIEKTAFSSCDAREFEAELERNRAEYVLICGI